MQTTTPPRLAHLAGCGWFWAWAAVGVVGAFGLDIVFLLPVAGVLAYVLSRFRGSRDHSEGILVGAGLPFLYVAYLNRQGPGTVCYTDGHGGGGCDEYLNPWPWIAIGVVLIVVGVVLYVRHQREDAPG